MFDVVQLRNDLIKPALIDLVMFSEEALELLVFTCAVESRGGTYLKQVKGPALGIYQMEPENHNDIWQNYLPYRKNILMVLLSNFGCNVRPDEDRLIYDLRYATAMARIHYARVDSKLPAPNDIDSIWWYYKQYYNTPSGSAQKGEAISLYQRLIAG